MSDDTNNGRMLEISTLVTALQELVSLETRASNAQMNALGMIGERMAPAARYGDRIEVKYRRIAYKTAGACEQWFYLSTELPISVAGEPPIVGLKVIDHFSIVEVQTAGATATSAPTGQYTGERLYLTRCKKWIIVERVGAWSEAVNSSSQWDARCTTLSNRDVAERYSLDEITQGILAAAGRVQEKIGPRLKVLRSQAGMAQRVMSVLSKLDDPAAAAAEGPASAAKGSPSKPEVIASLERPNCWEFKKCGYQPGGENSSELGVCPASSEPRLDGCHGGRNGGRACWFVPATACAGKIQGTYEQKVPLCQQCDFYQLVHQQEVGHLEEPASVLAKLR